MGLALYVIPLVILVVVILLGRTASGLGLGPRLLRGLFLFAGPTLILALWTKPSGPMWWFALPGWVFNPYLNWTLLVTWALLIPIRNLAHLAHHFAENRRLTSESREAPKQLNEWLRIRRFPEAALAAGLRTPPQVMLHPNLSQPKTLGLLNSLAWDNVVILPSTWVPKELLDDSPYWESFRLIRPADAVQSEDALFVGLLHELGHIRGGDTFAGLLALLGTLAFPLEWQPGAASIREGVPLLDRLRQLVRPMGKPLRNILQADLEARESRADGFAVSLMPQARGILQLELCVGERGGMPKESPTALVFAGSVAFLFVLAGLWVIAPGSAAMARGLGGRGAINGSLPSGWEILQWNAPKKPKKSSTANWGYVPASDSEPPRVHLEQVDSDHYLMLMSALYPSQPLNGPATVRVEWDFNLERGVLNEAFDLQLLANDLGGGEKSNGTVKAAYLPFAPKKTSDFQALGASRYRIVRELPVPLGLDVRVVHCVWVVAKPVSVLLSPPKVTLKGQDGQSRTLGGHETL